MPATESFRSNAPELAAGLAGLSARIGDPVPALERARAALAQQESEVWASQGAVLGVHWPPSADPERKVDSRLLVASGALRDSLTGPGAGRVAGNALQFGTDVPYGSFHQYGTKRMPARPFLGVSPELARRVLDTVSTALAEG